MARILVVTGSIRPNSVNQKIVPLVVKQLEEKGADTTIADLKELNLPFFDSPFPPAAPDFAPTDERVIRWTDMVRNADGVVFVTPEYNHTMTPVQLNAIDWMSHEWQDKPVALVGYGWAGGARAHVTAYEVLAVQLKAKVGEMPATLFFTKDLSLDGTILDESSVDSKIEATLDELLQAVS